MILIENNQTITINLEQLEKNTQDILTYLGYSGFDLSVLLCDSTTMQAYNKKYRNKDQSTDILSFPFYPNLKAGDTIKPISEEEKNVGDIIMCPEYVQEDLERWDQTFEERMQVLLVHGVCHLLGYDHIKNEDYELMKQKENELLSHLKKS